MRPNRPLMAEYLSSREGTVRILAVSGRLDLPACAEFRQALDWLVSEGGPLVIDLEKLEFMSSAGFRELFLVGRQLGSAGARLAVCGLRGAVRHTFELARFETAYPVFANRQEAVTSLAAS